MTRIVRTEVVRKGYATVTLVTLADASGREHQREVLGVGRAVCVLPYDPTRKVALVVRLPRAPLLLAGVEGALVEAPAGMIDPGEDPETTVRREAMEEVGLRLGDLEPVANVWPSPGVLGEQTWLCLAAYAAEDRVGSGGGLAEENEDIAVEEIGLAQLGRMQQEGALHDMKTLALVQALRLRRPELF